MTKKLLFAMTALVFAVSAYASAGSPATANLDVSAAVQPLCVVSTSPVAFGDYAGGSKTASGSIAVQCNVNLPYNVALDAGLNYGEAWRRVSNGNGTFIKYGIFKTGGGEWGDSDFANTYIYGSSVAGTGSGLVQTLSVPATIFGGTAFLPVGTYTDVVSVSVYY